MGAVDDLPKTDQTQPVWGGEEILKAMEHDSSVMSKIMDHISTFGQDHTVGIWRSWSDPSEISVWCSRCGNAITTYKPEDTTFFVVRQMEFGD